MTAEGTLLAAGLVMAYAFLWGLRRGSVACLAVCAPALLERSARLGGGWRSGVRWALVFNAPRVGLLTLFGAAAGLIAYTALGMAGDESLSALAMVSAAAYAVAGAFLALYGMYTFAAALDEKADIAEGVGPAACPGKGCEGQDRSRGPLPSPGRAGLSLLRRVSPQSRGEGMLAAWGFLLGVACLGETAVALEAALVGGAVGTLAGGAAAAALMGAGAMFLFGLGAALPVTIASGMCAAAVGETHRRTHLVNIRAAGGAAMMVVGAVLVMVFSPFILLL